MKRLLPYLFLFFVLGCVFAWTVHLRAPWFDSPGNALSAHFVTDTVLAMRNWYREGFMHLRGGMYLLPQSIEIPSLEYRSLYCSFPPGEVLWPYMVSLASRREPSLALVMGYNLANQFLVAALLSWIVCSCARRLRIHPVAAALPALGAGLLYLLLPSPLYQHQMRYIADHAVILPFVLFVALEVLRDHAGGRRGRIVSGLQGLVAFCGVITDWIFVFVLLCVFLKRLFMGQLGSKPAAFICNGVIFWLPLVLGWGIYLWQLHLLGSTGTLWDKFQLWMYGKGPSLFRLASTNYFWHVHMVRGYGAAGIVLFLTTFLAVAGAVVTALIRRLLQRRPPSEFENTAAVLFMASMPCFLHLFFLQSHSSFPAHYFSVLKVAVPLALGPFALIPLSAWALTGRPAGKHAQMACAAVLLALALGYIALEWLRVLPQFAREQEESVPIAAARFVGAHTGYADVVITANPELKLTYPSPYIGLSMKQVELALGLQRAYDFVAAVQDEYVINILFAEKDSASSPGLDELRQKAFEQIREGGFCMDRVRKADFLAACRAAHVSEPPPRVPLRKLNWPAQQDLIRRMGELIVDIDIPQK